VIFSLISDMLLSEQIIFFDSWNSLLRTLIIGILAYFTMVFLLRISGKRTLSKMNAFDFIVTVALGSTLAAVIITRDVALADGALAFAILIFMQYIITWLSYRSKTITSLIKSDPVLLFYRGNFIENKMKKERVTKEEIFAALREQGISGTEQAEAVIIETDGSLSVIKKSENNSKSTLENVN
jgi:uncharacterized membrane protein YcaP (DUF421 family)